MSTVLFVIMAIIAVILLIIASVTAVIAAIDVYASASYNTQPRIRSAHQYLTIASILGWSSVALLIAAIVVAIIFAPELFEASKSTSMLTKNTGSSGGVAHIIIIIILVILASITFAVGILSAIAATYIGSSPQKDAKASSAYTYSIASAIAGIGGIIIIVITAIIYFSISIVHSAKLREQEKHAQTAQIMQAASIHSTANTTPIIPTTNSLLKELSTGSATPSTNSLLKGLVTGSPTPITITHIM